MTARAEVLRFGAVGLLSNAVLYLVYLAITGLGVDPKIAVTGLYAVGVLQSFFLNRRWTFRHEGNVPNALTRYWASHAAAYLLNLILLTALVDWAGMAHQLAQGILTVLIASLTFCVQKFWVFRVA